MSGPDVWRTLAGATAEVLFGAIVFTLIRRYAPVKCAGVDAATLASLRNRCAGYDVAGGTS